MSDFIGAILRLRDLTEADYCISDYE